MGELFLVKVNQDSLRAVSEDVETGAKGSKRGELCVVDFFTMMALEGRCYNVQAGTITTPLTGDIDITDTKCEMCTDAATGYTVIPTYLGVDLESFAGGTIPECAAKSAAAISTSGTVFVALPIKTGGRAAAAICRVSAAGGVVVPAELVTTTRVHYSNRVTAQADRILADHDFRVPPVLVGPACFYVQVAATTAGPVYFAHYDFIELPSASVA